MDKQIGRPVLIEFWDFCRVNSLRTLPYMQRLARALCRPTGCASSACTRAASSARATRPRSRRRSTRLGIEYPVVVDAELEVWDCYGNQGWPARYLCDQSGALFAYHYGEGGYEETERDIQELLGVERELIDRGAARGRAGCAAARADARRAGRLQRPLRGGWRLGRGRGQRDRDAPTGARSRSTALPASRSSNTRHTPRACSSSWSATASLATRPASRLGRLELLVPALAQ